MTSKAHRGRATAGPAAARPRAAALLVAAFAVVGGVLTGCSADEPTLETASTTTTQAGPDAPIRGFFTVDGRKIFLTCTAGGSPAVVFLNEIDGESDDAQRLGSRIDGNSRFCAYDRPGTGVSAASLERTTGRDAVSDLHGLLTEAGLATPVVLVGEGWGALVAALYAAEHPADVAGLVLADPMLPADAALLRYVPAADAKAYTRYWDGANEEKADLTATFAQAQTAFTALPDVPTRVLQSDDSGSVPSTWDWKRIRAGHQKHLADFVAGLPRVEVIKVSAPSPLSAEVPAALAAAVADVLP